MTTSGTRKQPLRCDQLDKSKFSPFERTSSNFAKVSRWAVKQSRWTPVYTKLGFTHLTLRFEQRGVAEPCADHYHGCDAILNLRGKLVGGSFNTFVSVCVSWSRVKIHFFRLRPVRERVEALALLKTPAKHNAVKETRKEQLQ